MVNKAVQVNNLVKRYKKADTNAVDNISFSVKEGEFFAFLGPNGAGKTTTISILNTTLSKTSGNVQVAGCNVDTEPNNVRENIGVIFQKPSLDENLTAEENVRFHAVLYGLYQYRPTFNLMNKKYQKKVRQLSQILGIEDDMFKPIKSFSGGMKRKLEIIRSLIHNPKVLFLDEPTSGLDPASRKSLWKYLNEVRENEKTTMFLTTHYLEEAEEADHVVIISNGKLVADGTPKSIKENLVKNVMTFRSKDIDKVKEELNKMSLKYSLDNQFTVELNSKSVQDIIQSIKSPIHDIDISKPTLEEAYLEIINKDTNNT